MTGKGQRTRRRIVERSAPVFNTRGFSGASMSDWLRLVGRVTKDGMESGELSPETDPRQTASVMVATLEGALMLSRLHDDPEHMRRAVEHLKRHLGSLARSPYREGVET